MGTRSLTKIISTWENKKGTKQRKPITCMYRQYDGYLDGHGLDLASFLSQFTIVNGIGMDEERKIANGMDCLAAQIIAHFKNGPGDIYLMHPDTKDVWEDYQYEVEEDENKNLLITVYEVYNESKEVFHGTPEELLTKIEENVEH